MKCIYSFFLPSYEHRNGDESSALLPEFFWIYWSMQMSVHMTWCCMRDFPLSADQDCIADDTLDPYDCKYVRYQWSSLCLATGTLGLLGEVMASLPPEDCLNGTCYHMIAPLSFSPPWSNSLKLLSSTQVQAKKPVLDLLTYIIILLLLCHNN